MHIPRIAKTQHYSKAEQQQSSHLEAEPELHPSQTGRINHDTRRPTRKRGNFSGVQSDNWILQMQKAKTKTKPKNHGW